MISKTVCVGRALRAHLLHSNPTGLYLCPKNITSLSGEDNLNSNKLEKTITPKKVIFLVNLLY